MEFSHNSTGAPLRVNPLLEAALTYAARGWHVFPCLPGEKRPATRHGYKDATTDAERIRSWWANQPDYNIGLATGKASGVFVIDIDTKGAVNGYDTWGELCKAHEWRSRANVIAAGTPSGGCHIYFRHVEGITNGRGALPAGVDVRGDGGYVLVPPSRIAGRDRNVPVGLPYSWLYPDATDIMDADEWLLDVLLAKPAQPVIERPAQVVIESKAMPPRHSPREVREGITGLLMKLAREVEGNRNNLLYWTAHRFRERGYSLPNTQAVLAPIARTGGLAEDEIARTIESAYAYQGVKAT